MTEIVFVYVTHPDAGQAELLGRALVEQRLAASVNIMPGMRTIYRWQGRIETGNEAVVVIKTTRAQVNGVQRFVQAVHPYECPCIAALPVIAGNPDYFKWIEDSTRAPSPKSDPADAAVAPGSSTGRDDVG